VQSRRTQYGYALRLDRDEEIVGSLRAFADQHEVRAGLLSGLGALREAELGFFVRATHEYIRKTFSGEFEIASLTGNLSDLEGEPFPHVHVVISGDDFVAYSGHLFRGIVSVTCEVQVVTDRGVFRRVRQPAEGFNPLDLTDER
jgi:predicted DNA-binding protein with PD1-like motif